jgi:hypothetical protein
MRQADYGVPVCEFKKEVIMSIEGLLTANTERATPVPTEVPAQITRVNERVASFLFGAQKLTLEESIFLGNELLDRAQTEMHLFSELVSKMAGAHSVKDITTMYQECGKHQLEFMRRDCDRLFKNGERVIGAASNLFKTHSLN